MRSSMPFKMHNDDDDVDDPDDDVVATGVLFTKISIR